MEWEGIKQVRHFNYLGCDINYGRERDIEHKLGNTEWRVIQSKGAKNDKQQKKQSYTFITKWLSRHFLQRKMDNNQERSKIQDAERRTGLRSGR